MPKTSKRLKLHGFNNLTKSLSFNIYDICYTDSDEQRAAYIAYIDEAYNAERLTGILTDVAKIIGANVLNIARQDYEPQGASVTMLIAEEHVAGDAHANSATPGPLPDAVVGHLDKSHITVHTYPVISPLKALNYLIYSLESDIVIMDYRVRGFTRDVGGRKHFIDHNISSIQNYLRRDTKNRYQMIDVNVYQENLFHTKMVVDQFHLDDYLFCIDSKSLSEKEYNRIQRLVRREMMEIFYGRNLSRDIAGWE